MIGRRCEFLRRRAIAGVEAVGADRYARSVELNCVHGTVAVQRGAGNALRATVRFPKLSALPTIIARLRRVFDLAADPVAITAHLAKDPALAPLVKARPGLRVAGAWDGFELAMRAVLGQQITVVAAATLAARLVAVHGQRLATADAQLTHVFPSPAALATADLTSLCMPRSRAAALSAVAAAAVADPHLFDANCGLEDAVKRLRSIRGVGEWTATSPCVSCASPTLFRRPTSGCCAPSAAANGGGLPHPNYSTAPMRGGPGALTPPSTCGHRPERTERRRDPRHSFHIDHLAGHAAVDDEIRAGDEAGLLAVEEPEDDRGDVLRLADAAGRVLRMILAAQGALILRLDPAGTDAVDADIRSEADRERVSEGDDAALRGE
jgi:3-methyladenine DNA glycosylase/8-oxoguanine DNA glycosylase